MNIYKLKELLNNSFTKTNYFHNLSYCVNRILYLLIMTSLLLACQSLVPESSYPSKTIPLDQLQATEIVQPELTGESNIECNKSENQDQEGNLPPQVSRGHSLAYDSVRQKTILFGGSINCTWEYNEANWELIETKYSPPSNPNAELIYDSIQKHTFLIGGYPYIGKVWEYNGTNWRAVHIEGVYNPISDGWLTATYIPQKQAIYVLGACLENCSDKGHYSGWLFDGQSWTEEIIIPFGARPGEPTFLTPEIVYDEGRETLILQTGFGGKSVGSWVLNYHRAKWRVILDASSESGLNNLSLWFDMVYDSNRKVVVLFGAFDKEGQLNAETWEYDGVTWHQVTPTESPSTRVGHAMAYDQTRGVVIMYGGTSAYDETPINLYETWEYDGVTWVQK